MPDRPALFSRQRGYFARRDRIVGDDNRAIDRSHGAGEPERRPWAFKAARIDIDALPAHSLGAS
jgi:hypothetical protein